MTKLSSLTAFFPVYNEEKNVEEMVKQLKKMLPKVANAWEIVIVNDGSKDRTAAVAERLAAASPLVRVVHHTHNRGYGAALKTGFATAQYDWVFFTDGDLQFNIQQLGEFIPYTLKSNVVIGYRKSRAEGGLRAFNARVFKLFVDLLFRLHVKDIDCAFKLFKTRIVQSLELDSSGALISAEVLYKLKKKNQKFVQLPVDHLERKFGSSTGASGKVIIKAMWEFVRLYLKMKLQYL